MFVQLISSLTCTLLLKAVLVIIMDHMVTMDLLSGQYDSSVFSLFSFLYLYDYCLSHVLGNCVLISLKGLTNRIFYAYVSKHLHGARVGGVDVNNCTVAKEALIHKCSKGCLRGDRTIFAMTSIYLKYPTALKHL